MAALENEAWRHRKLAMAKAFSQWRNGNGSAAMAAVASASGNRKRRSDENGNWRRRQSSKL